MIHTSLKDSWGQNSSMKMVTSKIYKNTRQIICQVQIYVIGFFTVYVRASDNILHPNQSMRNQSVKREIVQPLNYR